MVSKVQINNFLEKIDPPRWVLILLAIVFLLRVPSFFEPYSYGDEMIYLTLGEGIRQGAPLYSGLHDNKPPLLYLMAAVSGNLVNFKNILAFWNLATILLFWKLSKVLFPENTKLRKVATIIFAIFSTLPMLEGNIVNAELFMVGPILVAFLVLLSKKLSPKNLVISGLLFSVAALFKIPAAFELPVIIIYWLIAGGLKKENILKVLKNSVYLTLGFIAPILLTFVWYYLHGAFKEYFIAAFAQNIGYLSSFRPGDTVKPFWIRNAPLLSRFAIILVGIGLLYLKRARLSKNFVFLTTWLLFTLFAVTLSERPYPHYLIQSLAPISFLLAILFTQKNMEQALAIIPLALAFLVPTYYRFYYYHTSSYYLRFLEFATGRISREQYFGRFDSNVNRNYKISEFIASSLPKEEKIFVWGDSPPIYALSKHLPPIKYVAEYHINDFSNENDVAEKLAQSRPKFIVVLSTPPPSIMLLLKESYILVNTIDGAEVWSRLSNGL